LLPVCLLALLIQPLSAQTRSEAELLAAAARGPDSPDAHFQLGLRYFQSGRLDLAEKHFRESAALAPKLARAWKALGTALAAQGKHPEAQEPFRKACALNPREPDACYYLARNHYVQNQFDEALALFEKLRNDPQPWRIHNGLGLALQALGRSDTAETEFRKAVELERGAAPRDEDPRINLGVLLGRQGRLPEALESLEAAAAHQPRSARARFELGRAFLQVNRSEEARAQLETAVQLQPSHRGAHALLGKVYYRLGQPEKAERHSTLAKAGLD
jgi:Flp pilus assembly protein TadD